MRADLLLVRKGLCESRQRAQNLIKDGNAYADGISIAKPSADISETADLELRGTVMPYVSRGGLKLEGALDAFLIDVHGMTVADIGASTGGFTDCLLQHGAKKVFAIDSGSGQLHPRLREDARVVCMENCNARFLTAADIGTEVDLVVCDLSFISQTKVYGAVVSLLREGGCFVSLIKPQFEAGKACLNKHGIVRDERVHQRVKQAIRDEAMIYGLRCRGMIESPITGGDGNREYLACFQKVGAGNAEKEREP